MKDVKIYTLDYCPYCKAAINFLKDNGVKYHQVRIDDNEKDMRREIGKLYKIKGEVTVPQIIIEGERIGGYTDMMKMIEEGKLTFS